MAYLMTPVQKARLTLDYLTSNGGHLPEEVADKFLVVTIAKSNLLKSVTTKKMKSVTMRLPEWEIEGQALHRRTRGQALPDGQRTTPTVTAPTMTAFDYSAEITLENENLESGVDGPGMLNLIMSTLSDKVSADVSKIVIQSTTVSADPDFNAFDGYYTAVTTNTAAAGTTRLNETNMTSVFKTMPAQFQEQDLTFRTGINAVIDYNNSVGDRPTNLGDLATEGKWQTHWHGVRVQGDQFMPQTLAPGNNTIGVLSNEKKVNVGFHRNITSAHDEDIRAGTIFIVFTVRMGFVWSVEKSAAQLTGILAS